MSDSIKKKVDQYYTEKVIKYGSSSEGVDWNGKESHFLRFDQLIKVINPTHDCSILDFGCGHGSLVSYLNEKEINYKTYKGFDISNEMIKEAENNYPYSNLSFSTYLKETEKFDFVIANGIFNVSLDTDKNEWEDYIKTTLNELDKHSTKGFSFNILTSYSDVEYMKDYLFYANPLYYFDFCKNQFSRNVALLHDYELYEFTIIVRK